MVVVDHDDSFTFNIVQTLGLYGARCQVVSSSGGDIDDLLRGYQGLVLSPGPCTPSEAGISLRLVEKAAEMTDPTPILGICLGHQVIAQAFGAELRRSDAPRHGQTEAMRHDGLGLHQGLPNPLRVARYNSLAVSNERFPDPLQATGWTETGEVMALRHRSLPLIGLQYHPESHLCPKAAVVLERWLQGLGNESAR